MMNYLEKFSWKSPPSFKCLKFIVKSNYNKIFHFATLGEGHLRVLKGELDTGNLPLVICSEAWKKIQEENE